MKTLAVVLLSIFTIHAAPTIKTPEIPTEPEPANEITIETTIDPSEIETPLKTAENASKNLEEKEPTPVKVDIVKENPQKCDHETQWIWEDGSCHDKPTQASTANTTTTSTPVQLSGSKNDWLKASGIPESSWWAVDSIVSRESGWNPNAVNAGSGACGLGQQLPCGKWAGAWNDPVAALIAMDNYVTGRYGGWPQAVAFWNANHWY